jgi:hypothetical protein
LEEQSFELTEMEPVNSADKSSPDLNERSTPELADSVADIASPIDKDASANTPTEFNPNTQSGSGDKKFGQNRSFTSSIMGVNRASYGRVSDPNIRSGGPPALDISQNSNQ